MGMVEGDQPFEKLRHGPANGSIGRDDRVQRSRKSGHADLQAATRQCLRLTLHSTGACAGQHACGNRACDGLPLGQFDMGRHPLRFQFHSYGCHALEFLDRH